MIKSFKLFLESNQTVTYEMLSEIIQFRNNSLLSDYKFIHGEVDNLIIELGGDTDELCPVTTDEYKDFSINVQNLISVVNSNPEFIEKVQKIYQEVESIMEGFPKFYELEDYFLELLDKNFNLQLTFKTNIFEINISNNFSDVKLDSSSYIELVKTCSSIENRLNSKYDCEIVDKSFTKQGENNIVDITFELTKKF